jgi:hypothetical protein
MAEPTCIIPYCTSIHHREFFRFPVESLELFNLWQQKMPFINFHEITDYENVKICENHFEDHFLYRKGSKTKKLLKSDAVPTIFDNSKPISVPVKSEDDEPEVNPEKLGGFDTSNFVNEAEEQRDEAESDESDSDSDDDDDEDGEHTERMNCRFCMKSITSNEVFISDLVKKYFQEVTNTEFVDHLGYSDVSCKSCYNDLKRSASVRRKFIKNQKKLLNLLGVPEEGGVDEPKSVNLKIKQEFPSMDYGLNQLHFDAFGPSHPFNRMLIPEIQHGNPRRKDYQCDYCGKKFNKKRLNDHLKVQIIF